MPLGVSGVMTMKMISSTSKISISGTTFISAIAPPLLSPTDIPMAILLSLREPFSVQPRRVGDGAARGSYKRMGEKLPVATLRTPSSVGRGRGRRRWFRRGVGLLGQQAELIHASGADFVYRADDVAVLGARVALHVHGLVQTTGNAVLDLVGKVGLFGSGTTQEDFSITCNSHDDGVILIGGLHFMGI